MEGKWLTRSANKRQGHMLFFFVILILVVGADCFFPDFDLPVVLL